MKHGSAPILSALLLTVLSLSTACHTTRHVGEGQLLLDHAQIVVHDTVNPRPIQSDELTNYLRQVPNHRVLGFLKLQLMTYDLSGKDSTKWYNRWLQRLGRPPVIYDQTLTAASSDQLRLALVNRGYMGAKVEVDTTRHDDKKKIDVRYNVIPGEQHTIRSITYEFPDSAIKEIIMSDSARFTVTPGSAFDRNIIDSERTRLTERLTNRGYYAFTKECITFLADTAADSRDVDLTMVVRPPRNASAHSVYRVRKVIFVPDYEVGTNISALGNAATDTVAYRDIEVLYGQDRYLSPKVLWENNFIVPGGLYRARQFDLTTEALNRLGIIKSINVALCPVTTIDGAEWMDAYILLTRNKKQGITFELEGTNSEGDFGFGAGLTYQHRNISKGSELLTAKLHGSYESLSGNFDGLINNRYTEFRGEVGITFPKFKAPFLSSPFKRRIRATSEFAVSFNYQERPEYTRIIAGAGWKYKWNNRRSNARHIFDLIDINYVYLPKSTINFLDDIAPANPLLRYSYEDHFIMRMGYTYYKTNKAIPRAGVITTSRFQRNIFTLRTAIEAAGNLLYAISSATGQERQDGAYKVFGIQYAQYVKGEADYMIAHNFDSRSTIAFHAGAGIGIPYGNSSMLPFEKRFYAGGANGVRGWGVRTLGPGRYDARNSVTDFINQCGDIRLDLSVEYRAKLFWVLEGALFIDAGNIWTIRDYENQPEGVFKFKSFYKELAWAYGIGLRMDFNYFLLRLDLGMKAYNPALNQESWPLLRPRWGRDSAFHFSVGYPF